MTMLLERIEPHLNAIAYQLGFTVSCCIAASAFSKESLRCPRPSERACLFSAHPSPSGLNLLCCQRFARCCAKPFTPYSSCEPGAVERPSIVTARRLFRMATSVPLQGSLANLWESGNRVMGKKAAPAGEPVAQATRRSVPSIFPD